MVVFDVAGTVVVEREKEPLMGIFFSHLLKLWEIHFVTARELRFRKRTEKMLRKQGFEPYEHLWMMKSLKSQYSPMSCHQVHK